jgi:DNA topoisomerase-3
MEVSRSGSIAVLAEKPSVARDIARTLGATTAGNGCLHGNGYVVTWAIGHLVALPQPHQINPAWKQWRRDTLPMLPHEWPLVVYDKTQDQFDVVQKILNSPRISSVVCATDAGREGELIFRYIYEAAHCDKPVRRLWISSLTSDAIRKGFESLRPGPEYDALADAARGRSRADWLVGMNLSRAYSLAYGEELSVGRVQTPTLAMLVERELAIRNFVPEHYLEVLATFHPSGRADDAKYVGTWFRMEANQRITRLPVDGPDGENQAKAIVDRARTGAAAIESIDSETQRMLPPLLYDLTELQRHANRLFGFSAQKTLDLAQSLYEKYKQLSNPRTDSRHLSNDVARTLPQVVCAIEPPYHELCAPGTGERPLGRRFVDDAKVSDHHAIIPTTTSPERVQLPPGESRIYDLVCCRLLSAWHADYISAVTTVITSITNREQIDRYHTSGTTIQQLGWKALDRPSEKSTGSKDSKEEDTETALPRDLAVGQAQDLLDVKAQKKITKPPRRLTEGTLLTAMETAGKSLEEKELSAAMNESGLGTPATRAAIIEVLLKRAYIERKGKSLEATEKGIRLIEVVHPEVKSPAMTGQWEAYLQSIHKGAAQLQPFLAGIEDYVRNVVGKVATHHATPANNSADHAQPDHHTAMPVVPAEPGETLEGLLHRAFGFPSFRANQEPVCRAVIEGRDVLLVMPTGSGKSLCYQLPALARGGTTLVVSPLIALMDDQASKLTALGFSVARIHSGLDRAASRQACIDYLNGTLQFLFIAPERLRVAGFPEMLAKRKPSLIAIDEAHCISQWGHDFRPDYRKLSQYLPALRPAPVMALTATATPIVQDDIARQLGLEDVSRFIHGFRRDNLAIEVVEAAPSRRTELICDLLQDPERRPAIVYAPTRKSAAAVAASLSQLFPAAEYHAGLDPNRRERVQKEFLEGRLEAIVATIAFGMGIDKPDVRTVIHTALPASLEAYYQEIGRAGRDGNPSRTILMQSYADRHTHDFFFERDYPKLEVLHEIFSRLGATPVPKAVLLRQLKMDPETFDKALEKLWIHGGCMLDYQENATRGQEDWRDSYALQAERRRSQIDLVIQYARADQCRMSSLVRHFGDLADGRLACGLCDFCAPEQCVAQRFRSPTGEERRAFSAVIQALRAGPSISSGKLYKELFPGEQLSRDAFEEVLGSMARAGLLHVQEAVFEKDGKSIPYRKVSLTRDGRDVEKNAPAEFRIKADPESPLNGRRAGKKKTRAKKKKSGVVPNSPHAASVEQKLRAWRLAEAKKGGIPAFRILTDRALRALAIECPTTPAALLNVAGIGPATIKKYGAFICRLCAKN